jgi:spore germination protein GerM
MSGWPLCKHKTQSHAGTDGILRCNPRVQAQIEETALQFPTVKKVKVFINGLPLSEYLSERN